MMFLALPAWIEESFLWLIRSIGAGLCNIIYFLISRLFQLFMIVSQLNILSSDKIGPIYERITLILTIVMVFYITFEFVKYVVQPDSMTDKEKGVGNIVKRMIIAIVLIAFVPRIFTMAYDIQNKLITNQVFSKIILGEKNIDFDTFGSAFSADMLGVFYGLNEEACSGSNYDAQCEVAEKQIQANLDNLREGNKVTIMPGIAETKSLEIDGEKQNVPFARFDGLLAVIIGGVILYLVVLYTIDVGTRYAQLLFLQIMSPIAIIGYISPKKDNIFSKWLKQCMTTYLDLFIRLSIIYFVLLIIDVLGDSFTSGSLFAGVEGVEGYKTLVYIVLVMGLLVFAQKAPKMISELLPVSGGAASIGYGLKGGDRFTPTVNGVKKTWNAGRRTVGGAAGAIGGVYKGFKDGKKHKAWSALKAGYQGLKAGAGKGGGIRKGLNAARDSVQKDLEIIGKDGTPLGADLKGGHYSYEAQTQDRIKTKFESFTKSKDIITNTADEVKLVKQKKAAWQSAQNGGKSAAEIEAARKEYKAAQKTVLIGDVVTETDASGNTITYIQRKDETGRPIGEKITVDSEDMLRVNSARDESLKLQTDINSDTEKVEIEVEVADPDNPGQMKKEKAAVCVKDLQIDIDDPDNPGKTKTVKVSTLSEKQFAENLGTITTAAEEEAKKIGRSNVYKRAHANATKKSSG